MWKFGALLSVIGMGVGLLIIQIGVVLLCGAFGVYCARKIDAANDNQ